MATELIISEIIAPGRYVMLSDAATEEERLLLGSEAVMSVLFQSGVTMATNPDGDLIARRKYALRHEHRGRLFLDIPESALVVVPDDDARGQRMIHAEMTKALVDELGIRQVKP